MNKRFLVKYLYKGKTFSVAFSEGSGNKYFSIGKALTIGSDPKLLWQIFNPKFPRKHDLITNDNGTYYVNLLKSFSIEVKKGDKKLDLDELKSLGLLKNNRLYLKDGYEGKIHIDENTTIAFLSVPQVAPLNSDQKKTIALFSKWPEVSAQQKVTRVSIISVILFIIIFASIVGWSYTPPRKKNIFDRTEANIISMQLEVPLESKEPQMTFYEDPVDDTGEGEAEAKAKAEQQEQERANEKAVSDRIAQRRGNVKASTEDRFKRPAGGDGAAGTGTALAVTNRVRGLRGTSRQSSFSDIDVDTGSEYGDIAASLGRQQDDQLNTAAVSVKGVSSDEVRGRKTAGIGSGGNADLGTIATNLGNGLDEVETLESTDVGGTDLDKKELERKRREVRNLTNQQKEVQISEWFQSVLLRQINQEYDRYKLRKTIRGVLNFTLIFKEDKIVRANIRGKGSINDKEFIAKLQRIIEGRSYNNIGDYTITITQSFD